MSYSEIARQMGIHPSRVVQLEQSGLRRMKTYLEKKGLKLSDILPNESLRQLSREVLDKLPGVSYTDMQPEEAV